MRRGLPEILDDIQSYMPGADWLGLQALLEELFRSYPIEAIPAESLLRLFERFPEHDGFGVFWSALHGVEEIPGYEAQVVESLERRRSQFGVLLAKRILNSHNQDTLRWHPRLRALVSGDEQPAERHPSKKDV